MNKFKKIAAILLIITLSLISFVYADNDNVANVDGSGGVSGGVGGYNENKNYMWQDKNVRAARVSLWDIENQILVNGKVMDLIDYSKISKSDVEKARRLTTMTKPQIIDLNYKYIKGSSINRNIKAYLDYQVEGTPLEETTFQTMGGSTLLYPESITFPDFYVTWTSDSHDGSDDTRLKHLKEWYSQDEHVEEILNVFSATEDVIEKYKNQKISILIEPLLYFGTNNNECEVRNERKGITEKFKFKETAWFMTAAEIGLLAKNGFAKYNSNLQTFDCIGNRHEEKEFIVPVSGHGGIGEVLYLYLPYGTYKENDNFINAIKSYKQEGAVSRINTEDGFEKMVKQLGCFEITASTSEIKNPAKVLLKYHSNLEQIGGTGSIDETYNKNVKIGDTILTNKTYPDSIASGYHKSDGSNYTYNSYTTTAGINGNSGSGKRFKVGKATQITNDLLKYATKETLKDENNKEYDLYTIILYVDWVFEESGDISPSLTLYEDELSYVYDYNSIDSSGETRKLQAKINNGGNQHPYNMCSHKTCYSTSEGNFTVSVSHNFIGADKENCVLNEQQETIGDDTYGIFGQEQDTPFVLSTGKEINHSFVGYRDKEKDKRTAYKDSSKNTAQANNALPKYDISYNYKPVVGDWTGDKTWNDALGFPYNASISGQTGWCLSYTHCNACVSWCESCDEDGDCTTYCCGWCDTDCSGGYVGGQLDSGMTYPLSNIKNTYDHVNLQEYAFVGKDTNKGDFIFPSQGAGMKVSATGDNTTNTTILPLNNSITTYNYYNGLEDTTLGNYNSKQLKDVEFYPFIRMRYKDTISSDWENAYILAQNKTGVTNYIIAEVGVEDTDDEPTLKVDSMWDNFADTMKGLSDNGITDKDTVVHGGSLISLSTPDSKVDTDCAYTNLGIEAYIFAVPDRLIDTIQTEKKEYYSVSEAKEVLNNFLAQAVDNIQQYRIEKLVAPGIYKQGKDEIAFSRDSIKIQGQGASATSFGKNKLNLNDKYYFKDEFGSTDGASNYIHVISTGSHKELDVFTIKSDIQSEDLVSNIRFYINDSEVETKKSNEIKPNNSFSHIDLTNSDWQKLNNITGFVDNYIKSLEFDVDGGHTRNNSRPKWYNEGQDGLSIVRLRANLRVGLMNEIWEINDPALTGEAKNQYDLRNWDSSTLNDKVRTVRYQLSPAPENNQSKLGYIGTIGTGEKALDVYLSNIEYLLRSKFIYIDNATVEDSNR